MAERLVRGSEARVALQRAPEVRPRVGHASPVEEEIAQPVLDLRARGRVALEAHLLVHSRRVETRHGERARDVGREEPLRDTP